MDLCRSGKRCKYVARFAVWNHFMLDRPARFVCGKHVTKYGKAEVLGGGAKKEKPLPPSSPQIESFSP
jgi:hypothetical protein